MVTDFLASAKATGKAAGLPNLRLAIYPGAIAVHPVEEMERNIREVLFPQIIKLLTDPVHDVALPAVDTTPKHTGMVFEGSFEAVNDFFYKQQWTDGLPIVPPTEDKVQQFLKYTHRSPADVLGVLHPQLRQATVHSIAVNGVMAGCRPEHMPVLVAIVETIADPHFHLEDAGSSAGWTPMIIINGPVIDRLGFNSGTGVLRVGNNANTSISRFLRLYMRNVAGFIPGVGDMATFGRPDFPVLAENEANSPWEPLSATRGFAPGDSVVTLNSVGLMSFHVTVVTQGAENILRNIAAKVRQVLISGDGSIITKGLEMTPQLVLSPVLARTIAAAGYTKANVQRYVYEHSAVSATEFDFWLGLQGIPDACKCVETGLLPAHFCESRDPARTLPLFHAPEELQIIVAGTPERNRFFVSQNVGRQGTATSKKINTALLGELSVQGNSK